jgi:hypothetical protein
MDDLPSELNKLTDNSPARKSGWMDDLPSELNKLENNTQAIGWVMP